MSPMGGRDESPTATVQLWGKGYRVTQEGEEFQRYIPVETPTNALEAHLATVAWGAILEPLYSVPFRELALQRCVLFDHHSAIAVAFAPTADKHGRPSLVLTSAAAPLNWSSSDVADRIGRVVSLAGRLATSYSEVMKGNPPNVGRQLRSGAFLSSREFALGDEVPDTSINWETVMQAVRQWRGINGVCTPRLIGLGANVVLGTKHEADTTKGLDESVDGYFDVRDSGIHPLSHGIEPWEATRTAPAVTAPQSPPVQAPELVPIAESLHRIERSLDRIAEIGGRFVDAGLRLLDHLTRDKRKR